MVERTTQASSPKADFLQHESAIVSAIHRVLHRGHYIDGDEVKNFEAEFAAFNSAPHAVGLANGTDAISVALRALGIGSGDAVVTVSHTASASIAAIRAVDAIPVFVDVDLQWGVMDPSRLQDLLTQARQGKAPLPLDRFKAIMPVHLYGHCADMPAIVAIAAEFGLPIVEDCAQAHGALTHGGRRAGTWGCFGAFSFYPTKNLGAIGDAGALISSDAELSKRARMIRQYGWDEARVSRVPGINSRLDELQAAILRAKLPFLDAANSRRAEIAQLYAGMLEGAAIAIPSPEQAGCHVYHQFAIRLPRRDELKSFLRQRGINTLVHYPVPAHLQPAYATSAVWSQGGLPNSERWANEQLSLPMYPQLSNAEAANAGATVLQFLHAAA